FIAAGRQDTFKFRARRVEDQVIDGKTGVQFLIEPDSLLRWLVDPLHVVYDPAARMLLEFRGVSNVINPATGEEYNVRIEYRAQPPPDAPPRLPPLG
ncbi:MAG TPA: hypothetical protein VHE37_06110, partial [Nevskiaceae bacterium]|nr:hypothetical protein [Nevskiaceae bacterium]